MGDPRSIVIHESYWILIYATYEEGHICDYSKILEEKNWAWWKPNKITKKGQPGWSWNGWLEWEKGNLNSGKSTYGRLRTLLAFKRKWGSVRREVRGEWKSERT